MDDEVDGGRENLGYDEEHKPEAQLEVRKNAIPQSILYMYVLAPFRPVGAGRGGGLRSIASGTQGNPTRGL